jgi:hypothetical protein
VRAEVVQGRDAGGLGFMLLFTDLRPRKNTQAARHHLEQSLALASSAIAAKPADRRGGRGSDEVMGAILNNASLAAMDIADADAGPSMAPLIEELESSTRRATALYEQLRSLDDKA